MAKIVWAGMIRSEDEFPVAKIPKKAKQLGKSESMISLQLRALPFVIPSIAIIFFSMFVKTRNAGAIVISVPFFVVGLFIGLLLIVLHEFLHAIAYPKEAVVHIGIMPKSLAAVAISSSPIKRNRFIFMSLLPTILGIIPLILFIFSDDKLVKVNGLIFGMAVVGLSSIYPDLYNSYSVVKNVPAGATLINHKTEPFYY